MCFCKELQTQKWIAFQFCLEGSCAFLFKSLRFMSGLNIHVTGSQLLREVLNCRFTMADISNSRFTPTAEELYHVGHQSCNTIPRGVKERCLAQIAEVLRFRLELRPVISLLRGELYTRQAIARGDDMCYMVVIPSIKLYRFEVGNILGEVQDTINRRYGIYLHHSDLSMEQADGNPIHRGYNFLDVVFSSLSSNWGQNFTPGYKICNLVVNYEQNIEALMLQEEVHLVT